MALAFLLLQTSFTKGSEDFWITHRWEVMKRLMPLQWYIYYQRLPHSCSQKAVTDRNNTHCSTSDKGQTRWIESIKRCESQVTMRKYRANMIPFSACTDVGSRHNCWSEINIWSLSSFHPNGANCTIAAHKWQSKIKDCQAKASSPLWPSVVWPDARWPLFFFYTVNSFRLEATTTTRFYRWSVFCTCLITTVQLLQSVIWFSGIRRQNQSIKRILKNH